MKHERGRDDSFRQIRFGPDQWLVGGALVALAALSWLYLILAGAAMSGDLTGRAGAILMQLMPMGRWGPTELLLGFGMWILMMTGMMIPAALPTILLYDALGRQTGSSQQDTRRTAAFVAGYLAIWAGFSLAATLLQALLDEVVFRSPDMAEAKLLPGALVLMAAGLYQFTRLKQACIANCRSPAEFLTGNWRPGPSGAFTMGAHHGLYCLGCCWLLMSLLFVLGVMNLVWIAALSILVLIEKLVPRGQVVGQVAGIVLVGGGAVLLAQSLV